MSSAPLLTTSPTSAEVARRAGVSRTTVSFVLNGVRNRGISEATRTRVLAVADELGYRPNIAARTLAGGASATVGLVMPQATHLYDDAFLAHLVGSINEACHRAGLKMLIESTDGEGREPGGFVDLVRSRRIDGLIVVNLRRSEHDHLRQLAAAGIPLVVLGSGRDGTGDFHTLGTDNHRGATLAVNHLLDLGHRCIAHVGFAPSEFHSVSERERGWRDALTARGISRSCPGSPAPTSAPRAAGGRRASCWRVACRSRRCSLAMTRSPSVRCGRCARPGGACRRMSR